MDQTVTFLVEDMLDPAQTREYVGRVSVKDPAIAGTGRNQVITSVGDRVIATPYLAVFDNGLVQVEGKNVRGTVKDDPRNSGGTVWQKRTYSVDMCPPSAVMPKAIGSLEPTPVAQSAIDEATTQALANARRGMVSLPMLLKELPASIRMISGRTRQVLSAGESFADYWYRLLKNAKNRNHHRQLVVDANSAYLEWLFGWKPFIMETMALCKAMNKEKSLKIVGRGRARRKETIQLPGAFAQQGNLRCWNDGGWVDVYTRGIHRRTSTLTYEHKVRASVRYKARSSWGADMARYGINWRDAAFDAVRLSFLLNFSTNIQDFFTAGSPMVDADWVTGHVTDYSFATADHVILSDLSIASQVTAEKTFPIPGQGKYVYKEEAARVHRAVLKTEPEPELVLRSVLDVKRAATLAAIGIVTQHNRFARAYQKFQTQFNKG